ncbi:MAG: sulfur reduction protein DsrS [Sulfuriflexus sp.]|nr:sulfur reduction protein DsrS [Sulfuriflexus sp.]
MSLSTEDNLRLNVMLANNVDAVRIDEGRMVVYGIANNNEMQIQLNPNCRDELYIKQVRELLSGHVLGSPGGYPVFLKRWTRMGQMKDDSLTDLLKLGEPEAVMAVVCAQGLTDELARLAWWAAPEAEYARRMLESELVVNGEMGRVLADFLIEFLPFEEDPYAIVCSVRLVLQGNLISDEVRSTLWSRGVKKNVFRIGFLEACPDELPDQTPLRTDAEQHQQQLSELIAQGNRYAVQLNKILSAAGQSFITTSEAILKKPATQEAVCALFNAVGNYFNPDYDTAAPSDPEQTSNAMAEQDILVLLEQAKQMIESADEELKSLLSALPTLRDDIEAMLSLASITDAIATPVFARTDAIGSVMRKKLTPVTDPLFTQFSILRQPIE